MTIQIQQFPYVPRDSTLGNASLAPMLPLTLSVRESVATFGLVDSGAAINVLPYVLGVQLGFDWEQQTKGVELSGNLAAVEARVVVVSGAIGTFAPVRLAFAWAKTDAVSVILGQVNFEGPPGPDEQVQPRRSAPTTNCPLDLTAWRSNHE